MLCEAEVKELLVLPIVFWLSRYILSKIVVGCNVLKFLFFMTSSIYSISALVFLVKVPLQHVGKEYTTDNGFIVPAISSELRKKLFEQAGNTFLCV